MHVTNPSWFVVVLTSDEFRSEELYKGSVPPASHDLKYKKTFNYAFTFNHRDPKLNPEQIKHSEIDKGQMLYVLFLLSTEALCLHQ